MPTNDPRMQRRFGRVTARPSEYLIQLRRGRVLRHGPGLSVFLWPGDTCTILPTSIQRTGFVADQITAERIGVAVRGIAVYRIADPLLAFRMLDFTAGGAALDHLSEILRDMFVGAARRLVANLTVDACLTRRKESIAEELLAEIQPVVGGRGRPEDTTDRGWGIVLDTIEIQEVKVLSERVFADMQAPYRAELESRARQAALARDERIVLREAEVERTRTETRRQITREAAEAAEQDRLQDLTRDERLREVEREAARRTAEHQLADALDQLERARRHAAADHAARLEQAVRDAEQARAAAAVETEARRRAAEDELALSRLRLESAALEADHQLSLRSRVQALEDTIPEARTRHLLVTEVLPAMARAIAESIGAVQITEIGAQSGRGTGLLASLVGECLGIARSFGVKIDPEAPPPPAA